MDIQVAWDETDELKLAPSFLDVYTTQAEGPGWFLRLGATHGLSGRVPTAVPYDCLIIDSYKAYVSEEGRTIYNHSGSAYLCSVDFTTLNKTSRRVRLRHENGSAGNGSIVVTVSAVPSRVQPLPGDANVRNLASRIVARAKTWQNFRPIDKDLAEVHIPKFACPFPWLPGVWFGVQHPVAFESEILFERALRAVARRRCWDADVVAAKGGQDMRVMMAEALGAIPNCWVYNADVNVDDKGRITQIDRFSADERVLKNGDCEDGARTMSTLAWSLRHGPYTTPLVVAAQKAVRMYVVCQMFGDVALPPDPANDSYRVGQYFAHSFNVFLPVAWVRGALQRGGGAAVLVDAVPGDAPTLTQDGISIEDPDAEHPTHPMCLGPSGLSRNDRRARRVDQIGLNYYKFPSSCLVVDDTIVSTKYGTQVHELGFVTGAKYGCTYEALLSQSEDVSLVPTCPHTAQEDAIAQKCVAYLHPIVPLDTDAPEPDLKMMEDILGARRSTACAPGKGAFFLQGHDCQDELYLRALRKHMPTGARVSYALDYFAKDTFTVEIFVASPLAGVGG